jgi:hypothetical protein
MDLIQGTDNSRLGAEDFLTEEQTRLLEQYHYGESVALTSRNLQEAA